MKKLFLSIQHRVCTPPPRILNVFSFLIFIFLGELLLASTGWQSDVRLTNVNKSKGARDSDNSRPLVVDSEGNVYVTYYQVTTGYDCEVYLKWLDVRTSTWSQPILVSDTSTFACFPSCVVVPGNESINEQVWIAWVDARSGQPEGRYRVWDVEEQTWEDGFNNYSQPLTDEGGYDMFVGGGSPAGISLVASPNGDKVYSLWAYVVEDDPEVRRQLYYRICDEGNWGDETPATSEEYDVKYPVAAYDVESGFLHICYTMEDVSTWDRFLVYRQLDAVELEMSQEEVLYEFNRDELGSSDGIGCPMMSQGENGDLHLVFFENIYSSGRLESYYLLRKGGEWQSLVDLSNTSGSNTACSFPSVTIDASDAAWAFWEDSRNGNYEIYSRKPDLEEEESRRTQSNADAKRVVACSGPEGNVHLVWTDLRNGSYGEIYYKYYDHSMPVAPTGLSYQIVGQYNNPKIQWTVSSSKDVAGYRIYRNGGQVGAVNGYATSFTDYDVSVGSGTTFTYTVKAIDGASNLSDASSGVTVTGNLMKPVMAEGSTPVNFQLEGNYPNPFNPSTEIKFGLPHGEYVKLDIFNITGQLVATLVSRTLEAGYHRETWNGKDNFGRQVASGTYVYRLRAGDYVNSKRMLFVK